MKPLIVHLHGKRVGVLEDDSRQMIFRYDDAWLANPDACALSRQLPLQSGAFEDQRVSVFFGGLLPEADARDQIASVLSQKCIDTEISMDCRLRIFEFGFLN